MLRRCVDVGFRHVSNIHINRLYRMLVLKPGKAKHRAKLQTECLIAVMLAIYPRMTSAQLHQFLLCRLDMGPNNSTSIKIGSEMADAVFDSTDKAELRSVDTDSAKQPERLKQKIESLRAGSKFLELLGHAEVPLPCVDGKTPPPTTKPRKPVDCSKLGVSRSEIKKYLPKQSGATLQPRPERRTFQGYYPGVVPGSRSRTWGFAFSKPKCLRHVLCWIWEEHFKATGQRCPYAWLVKR